MPPPHSPALIRLQSLESSPSDFGDKLVSILFEQEYALPEEHFEQDDLVWLIDYLDEALCRLNPSSSTFQKCLHKLKNICGAKAILPESYKLSPQRLEVEPTSSAIGGFGDIHNGTFDSSAVRVLRLRVPSEAVQPKVTKTFCEEVVIRKHLEHPNILPLLGITSDPLQLVSNWVCEENILQFIQRYPDADRQRLLYKVAEGLCYLHSRDVVHGDLMGANILVENSGQVRIADFGLVAISQDLDSIWGASRLNIPNLQWVAPEVRSKREYSKKADVFSFAIVTTEVFADVVPLNDHPPPAVIAQGEHPPRPTHPAVTESLWALMQRCWNSDPQLRPKVSEVLEALTPNPSSWERLIDPTLSANERIDLITSIFSDHDEANGHKSLSGGAAQAFVDEMDEILGELDKVTTEIRRRCLRALYRVCGREALVPKSLRIPVCYNPMENPQCSGEFSDVWKGEYNGREVAAKVLRIYVTSDLKAIRKRFCKEVSAWRSLRHPNIMPLLGVTMGEKQFVIMSEWMDNGNIIDFLKDRDVNRLQLLVDITKGLMYMHELGIVHGNIKGRNILVDDSGRALLAGFSRVAFIPDQPTFVSLWTDAGTVQWMSPELLDPEKFKVSKRQQTKESDCYALGMVVYEVLSGRAPFGTDGPFPILRKVLNGEHPLRPQDEAGRLITDDIWDVLERCWKTDPKERASAQEVLQRLEGSYPIVGEADDQWDDLSADSPHDDPDTGRNDPGSPVQPDRSQALVRPPDSPPRGLRGPVIPGPPPGRLVGNMHPGWIRQWVGYIPWGILTSVTGYFGRPAGS